MLHSYSFDALIPGDSKTITVIHIAAAYITKIQRGNAMMTVLPGDYIHDYQWKKKKSKRSVYAFTHRCWPVYVFFLFPGKKVLRLTKANAHRRKMPMMCLFGHGVSSWGRVSHIMLFSY